MKTIDAGKLIDMIKTATRAGKEIDPEKLIQYIDLNSKEANGTRKIVINHEFGGFTLTSKAKEWLGYAPSEYVGDHKIARDDPKLIECIEALGKEALVDDYLIVEIPADVDWVIEEYDGLEWVAEKHRTWGRTWEDD